MASSFWGGVADSLGQGIQKNVDRNAEKRDYEWRLQKTQELEEKLAKTRIVQTKTFEKDGQYFAQGVNASGEPVGVPVPAAQWQIEEEKYVKGARDREARKDDAAIKRDETATSRDSAEIATIPGREQRANSVAAANAAESYSGIKVNDAQRENIYEDARSKRLENDYVTENGYGSILGAGGKRGGGRSGAAGGDDTQDWARVSDEIEAAAMIDEDLAETMREAMEIKRARGKPAAEILADLVNMRRGREASDGENARQNSVLDSLRASGRVRE